MPGGFFLFKKAGKRSGAASPRENFLFRQFAPQAGAGPSFLAKRKEAKIRQGSAFGIRFWNGSWIHQQKLLKRRSNERAHSPCWCGKGAFQYCSAAISFRALSTARRRALNDAPICRFAGQTCASREAELIHMR